MTTQTIVLTLPDDEKLYKMIYLHLLLINETSIKDLVIDTFKDKKTQRAAFQLIKRVTSEDFCEFNSLKSKLMIYEMLIHHFILGGTDYKDYFTNFIHQRVDDFYNECTKGTKNEGNYLHHCNFSKEILDYSNELWKSLDI